MLDLKKIRKLYYYNIRKLFLINNFYCFLFLKNDLKSEFYELKTTFFKDSLNFIFIKKMMIYKFINFSKKIIYGNIFVVYSKKNYFEDFIKKIFQNENFCFFFLLYNKIILNKNRLIILNKIFYLKKKENFCNIFVLKLLFFKNLFYIFLNNYINLIKNSYIIYFYMLQKFFCIHQIK